MPTIWTETDGKWWTVSWTENGQRVEAEFFHPGYLTPEQARDYGREILAEQAAEEMAEAT